MNGGISRARVCVNKVGRPLNAGSGILPTFLTHPMPGSDENADRTMFFDFRLGFPIFYGGGRTVLLNYCAPELWYSSGPEFRTARVSVANASAWRDQ